MMFKVSRCMMLILAAALVLGPAGCGKVKEKVAEKITEKAMEHAMAKDGSKAKVDLSKQQFSIQTKDGQQIDLANGDKSLKVPADFPKDIYVYDKAAVKSSMKTAEGRMLNLESADPMDKIVAQYKAKMTAAGWTEKANSEVTDMTMLEYEKDKQQAMVQISKSGDNTQIILTLQKASE